MKKIEKIAYYVVTGLFSAMIVMGASNYIFNHEAVLGAFEHLGFPTGLIYPMAAAKILGVIAIWQNKSPKLKEWAYAGFFFNLLLAVFAHMNAGDGEQMGAIMALALAAGSYGLYRRKEIAQEPAVQAA